MSPLEEDSGNAKSISRERPIPSGWGRVAVCVLLLLCLVYLFYSNSQFKKDMRSEIDRLEVRLQALENRGSIADASLSGQILGLKEELDAMRASAAAK